MVLRERVTGIEPVSDAWKAPMLAVTPHAHKCWAFHPTGFLKGCLLKREGNESFLNFLI